MSSRYEPSPSTDVLFANIESVVRELRQIDDRKTTLRDRVRLLIVLRRLVNEYGASLVPDATSGRARVLAYLRAHVGEPVDSEELAAVSGIQDGARRIRELRAAGYDIATGGTAGFEGLAPDQYVLLDAVPRPDGVEP